LLEIFAKRSLRRTAVVFALIGALLATACTSQPTPETEPTDEAFLQALVEAWTERWDYFDDPAQIIEPTDPKYDTKLKEQYTTAVDSELALLEPYLTRPFKQQELKTLAEEYVGLLAESKDSIQYLTVDPFRFETLWTDVYNRRTMAIIHFIDTYDLEIPEEHADTLADLRTNAGLASTVAELEAELTTIVCSLQWQEIVADPEFEHYEYEAVATNSTDIDFSNVGLDVPIIDDQGVNRGNGYANLSNWRVGQTAAFNVYSNMPIAAFDVSVQWNTIDGEFGQLAPSCS
jgi:hypothetical protein